ncbi:MAG: class I tRNA ligase family protein, partial [Phycisphaerales bacterium]|nr:class I tRNA ligase family protein [Phycisphaerales bacterium]
MTGSTPPPPGETAQARSYKKTLNLPKTGFPMKANLVQNEPASLKRWDKAGFYAALREKSAGKPKFCFHDGPPYANGSIHLGHLMNKCLKDFVVRTKGMLGYDVPFVPGWDCHGLPIEHKVMTGLHESGKAAKLAELEPSASRMAIRRECKKYAEKYVKLQSGQMKRLLTLADYDDPYLTMHTSYEGAVLEVLAGLVAKGLVFRALKPVHWSIANETALADAELEYEDREDISVYVDFEAEDAAAVYAAFGLGG